MVGVFLIFDIGIAIRYFRCLYFTTHVRLWRSVPDADLAVTAACDVGDEVQLLIPDRFLQFSLVYLYHLRVSGAILYGELV